MKILITGATGFIGGNIYRKLDKNKHGLRILVRDIKYKNKGNSDVVLGDLRSFDTLKGAVKGCDAVINCAAALPHDKLTEKEYKDINILGVDNLVKACLEEGIKRFIHISTVGIYGSTNEKIVSESSNFSPKDVYARSKLEGEKLIRKSNLHKNSVILRPTIAYGPGDTRPVFLNLFKIVNKGFSFTIGYGENFLHTLYIDNLTSVIIKAITAKDVQGEDFIIGDSFCPTMNQILTSIQQVENRKTIHFSAPKSPSLILGKIIGRERTIKFLSENRKFNIDKAKKYFKITHDVGLNEGMMQTFNWYKKEKIL